jgi:hypothetical protein
MLKLVRPIAIGAACSIAVILASAPTFSAAQPVSSFENNLSSTVGATWEGPGIPGSEFVNVGATDGASALAIHHPTGWNIQAILKGGMQLAQQAATHDFLLIDATTADLGVAGDGWSPSWRQIFVVFNSNQGGWQQTQLDFPVASDDGGSSTTTIILDLAASGVKANAQAFVDAGAQPNTWWELFLPMQGGDQGTAIKAGDYAADDKVTAADYVNWRNNVGGTSLTNETVSLGSVDAEDYTEWKAHFGKDYTLITTIIDNVRFANAGAGAGSLSASAAPEPSSALLALVSALALSASRWKRS